MYKIFKSLNEFTKSKYFKILLGLIFVFLLLYVDFDKKYVDFKKGEEVFSKLFSKKIKKLDKKQNISDIIDAKYETMVIEKPDLKRKKLIPDSEIKKELKKEEEVEKITNVFLKLKNLEDRYNRRLKNNQINKSRRIKYGDYIYYSMEAIFDGNSNKRPTSHFFIKISEDDFLSKKLIGKKVGQSVEFNYVDMANNISKEEKKIIEDNLEKTMDDINKKYSHDGVQIFKSNKLLYKIKILDFIPEKIISDLSLDSMK